MGRLNRFLANHRSPRTRRSLRRAAVVTVVTLGILVGAAAVPLGAAAPANADTSSAVAPSEIINRAVDQAKKQGAARDYTAPITKPQWKVLFVGLTDVIRNDGRPRQTMNANARTYYQNVVNQFVDVLDKKAGVRITPTLKWVEAPFRLKNPTGRIDTED